MKTSLLLLTALAWLCAAPLAARAQAPASPPPDPAPAPAPAQPSPPAAPGKRWEAGTPKAQPAPDKSCREEITADPTLDAAVRALTFERADGRRPLKKLQIAGLKTLDEKALWTLLGGPPEQVDAAVGAIVLRQLAGLGLFAEIKPVIDVRGDDGPTLVINVVEHPTVRKVVIEGLGEQKPEELLHALLEAPSRREVERQWKVQQDRWKRLLERASEEIEKAARSIADERKGKRCPDPLPAREWVARAEDSVVFPGVVWRGLPRGLERVMKRLFDKGYEMSSLSAELGRDGTLVVRVDEGRIARVDVAGVAPQIDARVRELVGIQPGKPFVRADLDAAIDRVVHHFPFLDDHRAQRKSRARPRVVPVTGGAEGALVFRTAEEPADEDRRWYTIEGGTLTLHFRARRITETGYAGELIRHTPVSSFAPGLESTFRHWDAADRVHLRVDVGGNVNTKRVRAVGPDAASWRFDWAAAGSLQVPLLRLAEIGVLGQSRADTSDRWRIHHVDSYLYSLFFNRPDSDYFRRTGLTAFATFHVFERITAGIEYRRDEYRSLAPADVFTVFNRDEVAPAQRLVQDGRIGSLLLRLEASTEAAAFSEIGGLRRDPERSIVNRSGRRFTRATARTVNTLEIANASLGSQNGVDFVRLVSDSAVYLRTLEQQGLKLRFRAAGQLGGSYLPAQKAEALGGWTALRGYGFKELGTGTFSLLGTAEYRLDALSLFVDTGSVRSNGAFGEAQTGVGVSLNFGDKAHLDLAWRTDEAARLRPEIRFLFHRSY